MNDVTNQRDDFYLLQSQHPRVETSIWKTHAIEIWVKIHQFWFKIGQVLIENLMKYWTTRIWVSSTDQFHTSPMDSVEISAQSDWKAEDKWLVDDKNGSTLCSWNCNDGKCKNTICTQRWWLLKAKLKEICVLTVFHDLFAYSHCYSHVLTFNSVGIFNKNQPLFKQQPPSGSCRALCTRSVDGALVTVLCTPLNALFSCGIHSESYSITIN